MKIPRISSVVTGHDAYRDGSLVGREGELGVTVAETRRRIDIRYSRRNELMKKIAGRYEPGLRRLYLQVPAPRRIPQHTI